MSSLRVLQGLAEPDPRGGWAKGYKWSSSWGLVLLLLILVSVLLVGTLINIRRGLRHSGQCPSCSVVHFPSGSCPLGWGTALATVTRSPISQKSVLLFPCCIFFGRRKLDSFFKSFVSQFCLLLGMLVAKWEPTPCYRDAYLVDVAKGPKGVSIYFPGVACFGDKVYSFFSRV